MKIPLFDAHCDTAFQMLLEGYGLFENPGHVDLKRALRYAPYAQFFAFFVMTEDEMPEQCERLRGKDFEDVFELELKLLLGELEKNSDKISLCRTAAEIKKAARDGKAAAMLSIEGAEAIGCGIDGLRKAYELGVRAVNPVWNRDNALGGCAASESGLGLTYLGQNFCLEAERLGMILDVSHLSEQGFWELCETVEAPFMASHSNSKALCGHVRNLTDGQFCEIVRRGGVAGINFYADFVGESPNIYDIVRHIEHFMELGGEKTLAIGGDLDGCDSLPEGIKGIENVSDLYEALLRENYGEDVLRGIFYENLLGLVETICGT